MRNLALGEHTLGLQRLTEAFPSLAPQPRVLPTALSQSLCFFVLVLFYLFSGCITWRVIFVP